MRILIISTFFPPQNSIASHRPYSWAKYWSKAGHEVCVVTTPKRHHDPQAMPMDCSMFTVVELSYGNFFDSIVAWYKRRKPTVDSTKQDQSNYHKERGWISKLFQWMDQYRGKIGVFDMRRFPDFSHFWAGKAVQWAKENGPWDLVVSTYAPYTTHLVAYRLKKYGHVSFWVADYRDLWTDDHIFKGMHGLVWYESMLEKKLLTHADLLTTVSDPLAEKLQQRFVKHSVVIENGYEPADLGVLPIQHAFAGLPKKIRLVYTGSIYKSTRDPSPLFEAIARIVQSDNGSNLLEKLEILFVGGNIGLLSELISQYQVHPWVRLQGFVTRTQALMMQRDADALLFLESNSNGVDGILTGKIFEYLSSGTEVWAIGVNPESTPGILIRSSGAGLVYGKDVDSIQTGLIKLMNDGPKKKNQVDLTILNRYTREGLALRMLDTIVSSIQKNSAVKLR